MKLSPNIFVVIDPTSDQQPALERAVALTDKACSSIHLFMCDYKDPGDVSGAASKKDAKYIVTEKHKEYLEGLIAKYEGNENAKFTYEIYWNKGWYDAVGCASTRRGSSLIVKSTFKHSKTSRYLNKTSDWHLIKRASSPILFVREDSEWKTDKILAAIDLEANDEEHIRLNNMVVRQANTFAQLFGMELYVVNASTGRNVYDHLKTDDEADVYEMIENRYGVPKDRVIIKEGTPKDVISSITEELKPDLLVMGTIGRKGLAGMVFGNTAAAILDEIEVDVLAVT